MWPKEARISGLKYLMGVAMSPVMTSGASWKVASAAARSGFAPPPKRALR